MNFLHTEIGSAKDNARVPIHNWYKFTAGFSCRFVDEIIAKENMIGDDKACVFDPFAGCGTTLVSSQKLGVKAIGHEGQAFMYDVIRAKINWRIDPKEFERYLKELAFHVRRKQLREYDPHPLLETLYATETLEVLYKIRDAVLAMSAWKYRLFFKLALSQTLHKVSLHPIAVPYIVRRTHLQNDGDAWGTFVDIATKMSQDVAPYSRHTKTSTIYLQDSRRANPAISANSCSVCITSPPYLNNLDYGEVSKVHSHFFDLTNSWHDITTKVRHKLVTGSTTHYRDADFSTDGFLNSELGNADRKNAIRLVSLSNAVRKAGNDKGGKKSFDLLLLHYFRDMFLVIQEIRRVLRPSGKAYLILGDSALYGIRISTTRILGDLSLSCGFRNYEIHHIRDRGNKWQSLKHRHGLSLTENVLVLQ